jgi:hypothetical protein
MSSASSGSTFCVAVLRLSPMAGSMSSLSDGWRLRGLCFLLSDPLIEIDGARLRAVILVVLARIEALSLPGRYAPLPSCSAGTPADRRLAPSLTCRRAVRRACRTRGPCGIGRRAFFVPVPRALECHRRGTDFMPASSRVMLPSRFARAAFRTASSSSAPVLPRQKSSVDERPPSIILDELRVSLQRPDPVIR